MLTNTTVKAIAWSRPDHQGLYPINIRITIASKRSYIPCGFSVAENYWDTKKEAVKKDHPEADNFNGIILTKKAAINAASIQFMLDKKNVTADQLKQSITGDKSTNFFSFVANYIEELKTKREPGTIEMYLIYLKMMETFWGSRNLAFNQIDRNFLVKFEKYLQTNFSKNTVNIRWVTFMGWLNAAVAQKIISEKSFESYETPSGEIVDKEYLTMEEIDILEKFADNKTNCPELRKTAIWFLHGCFTGLRISDWEVFSFDKNIVNGEVRLRAFKNEEFVSLPLYNRLQRNLDRMNGSPYDMSTSTFWYRINNLADKVGIKKHLSAHCGRKTFAVTLCSSLGIDLADCAYLMGISIEVCRKNYYRITNKSLHKKVMAKWETC